MMPDLGKYATEVLSAYVVSLALIVVLVLISWRQSQVVRARLREVERRRDPDG
ncbi:MAG: heme exporter protein CcmD [Rhodobacteraceae bacterium]|nr:heme exporter protein CcmD [Paracoccaceae bacterium]